MRRYLGLMDGDVGNSAVGDGNGVTVVVFVILFCVHVRIHVFIYHFKVLLFVK